MRALTWILLSIAVICCSRVGRAATPPHAARASVATSVDYDGGSGIYTFSVASAEPVIYLVDVTHPDLAAGMLRIDAAVGRRAAVTVVAAAGLRWRESTGALVEPAAVASRSVVQQFTHSLVDQAVVLDYRESISGVQVQKRYRIRLAGAALAIDFESDDSVPSGAGYAGVALGRGEGMAGAEVIQLPYLVEPIAALADGTYLSAYLDRTVSSSGVVRSVIGGPDGSDRVQVHGLGELLAMTDGSHAALREQAYVTLSDDIIAVLPEPTTPASAFRNELSPRLVVDVWGQHQRFPPRESVLLRWQAPLAAAGTAQVTLTATRPTSGTCGDGVLLLLRHGAYEAGTVEQLRLAVDDHQTHQSSHSLELASGDEVQLELQGVTDNNCDGTEARLSIAAANGTPYDSQTDFSTTQGGNGFFYDELVDGAATPMQYDSSNGVWMGAGSYSIIGAGFMHPGRRANLIYRRAAAMVRQYHEYGLDQLAWIFHDWQRHGYDQGLPDHHPANPAYGSDVEMAAFVETATSRGQLIALHENYTDMYPDNAPQYPSPLFDATAIAVDATGARKLGWYQTGTLQQAFRIAADRMVGFARVESTAIQAGYATNASYLDVSTGWSPAMSIDQRAGSAGGPSLKAAFDQNALLYGLMHTTYQGPLFGEGGEGSERFDSVFAGLVDAVERQTEGRRFALVAPEYELLIVKPRMLNHGLGYHSRYFVPGAQATPAPDQYDLDQYRASELAFGHAGFLDDGASISANGIMREHAFEYWLVQALQRRYADATPTAVRYQGPSQLLDLGAAVRAGLDLRTARIRIDYDNGLQLWVNRDAATGGISSGAGFSHEQGRDGFGYYEVDETTAPTTLVPLQWDAALQRWQGVRPYSQLHGAGGHPDHTAVVRTWTSPVSGNVRMRGVARRPSTDNGCGDGVDVRIVLNGSDLWSSTSAVADTTDHPFDLTHAVSAGDRFEFWIAERANNYCDSTEFAPEISWQDSTDHSWTVVAGGENQLLPPSGWVATATDGLLAYSALVAGQRVEFVGDSQYTFARVRDTTLRLVENIATDGAIALVNNAIGAVDVHGLGLTRAEQDGALVVELSVRADVNLRYTDPRTAQLAVRDSATGGTVDLTLVAIPAAWRAVLAAQPGAIERRQLDPAEVPVGPAMPVTRSSDGSLTLLALAVDQRYQLRLTSQCVESSECGQRQVCAGGSCVAAPFDAGAGDAASSDGASSDRDQVDAGRADATGLDANHDGGGSDTTIADRLHGSDETGDDAVAEDGCGCRAADLAGGQARTWVAVLVSAFAASIARRRRFGHLAGAAPPGER